MLHCYIRHYCANLFFYYFFFFICLVFHSYIRHYCVNLFLQLSFCLFIYSVYIADGNNRNKNSNNVTIITNNNEIHSVTSIPFIYLSILFTLTGAAENKNKKSKERKKQYYYTLTTHNKELHKVTITKQFRHLE